MELVRRAEHCGVAWVTVHGRTIKQRAESASMEAIKLVSEPTTLASKNIAFHKGPFLLRKMYS